MSAVHEVTLSDRDLEAAIDLAIAVTAGTPVGVPALAGSVSAGSRSWAFSP